MKNKFYARYSLMPGILKDMIKGNSMKFKNLFLLGVLVTCVLTGCKSNESTGLKVGPTVTPMPEKATGDVSDFVFDYTDEEVEQVVLNVYENVKNLNKEYDFEITDDMVCENLTEHSDGTSEVYVYDNEDNMLAILMYDGEKHLYKAFVNEYENSRQVSGCEYSDGKLVRYYETAEGTGAFRVEAEIMEDGSYKLSYTSEDGVQYREFDVNK